MLSSSIRSISSCYPMYFHLYRRVILHSTKTTNAFASRNTTLVVCRKFSSLPAEKEPDCLTVHDKFGKIRHIYKFPYISYCNWIINVKWYALPPLFMVAFILENSASEGLLPADSIDLCGIAFVVIIVKCVLMGLPFKNFVGHIFISPEDDIVLSYLNFGGSRIDEKFPKGDLHLQSRETGPLRFLTKDSFYMLLISRSTNKTFRINFKHCEMFDEDLFRSALGVIPESAVQ